MFFSINAHTGEKCVDQGGSVGDINLSTDK